MTFIPQQKLPFTAFDELLVANPVPIIQILGARGLNGKTTETTSETGSTSVVNSEFVAQTGTNALGIGAIASKDVIAYRSGQGVRALFTARFTPGVANSRQAAGINNPTNGYNFGFVNDEFGITRRFDGVQEIQDLQVTVAATGSENATVTIDGTGYTVALTSGTVQHNAAEISDSLNTQVENWMFEQNDDTVVAVFELATTVAGSFIFSSSTAEATWTQISAGAQASLDFIAQADWNLDPMPDLDPTKGNVYGISVPYLGYGDTCFSIKSPETGRLTDVHRFPYANLFTRPHVSDPTFVVSISAVNLGNTSNLTVTSSSMSAFNEGIVVVTEPPRSLDIIVAGVTAGTEIPIISIRNRLVTPLATGNLSEVIITEITGSTDSAKGMIFRLYINGDLVGADFDYVNKSASISSVDEDATAVTGEPSFPLVAVIGATARESPERLKLQSGDTLTMTAQVVSGAASEATLTIVYVEDL